MREGYLSLWILFSAPLFAISWQNLERGLNEGFCIKVLWVGEEACRLSLLHNTSVFHNEDAVAHGPHHFEIMADEQVGKMMALLEDQESEALALKSRHAQWQCADVGRLKTHEDTDSEHQGVSQLLAKWSLPDRQ
ncbi:MAG: hypothetical protein K0R76_797 [Alphaproteobacteria bacterium]|nr:hypothetical protein [Alphaproteobacteria bacterium]